MAATLSMLLDNAWKAFLPPVQKLQPYIAENDKSEIFTKIRRDCSKCVLERRARDIHTCFDVSVSCEELQSAFETPDTTVTAPQDYPHEIIVVMLQAILHEGNYGPYQSNNANDQRAKRYRAQVISYQIAKATGNWQRKVLLVSVRKNFLDLLYRTNVCDLYDLSRFSLDCSLSFKFVYVYNLKKHVHIYN